MRGYIFPENEREMLENWLETGEINQELMNLFTKIRDKTPALRRDMHLLLAVLRKKNTEKRGRGYVSRETEFGSALRRAESALIRTRRGTAT